ncbi:MAG TPA: class I SAM-dependent methyltransferase [Acidimicrobiia bacterium]|nr:class I SAM-dependent methyltransferase [Acidimicrobiia bacterium]
MAVTRAVYRDRTELFRRLFPRDGVVVEIGSQRGVSARAIVHACQPRLLVLVDPWRKIGGAYENDPADRPTRTREEEMRVCAARVGCMSNVAMLRCLSHEANALFADGSCDAVYLDGDHSYEGVAHDIEMWWPKVKSGGVLAGHDYTIALPWVGVMRAVDEWVVREGLDLQVTESSQPRGGTEDKDGALFPSWAVVKP